MHTFSLSECTYYYRGEVLVACNEAPPPPPPLPAPPPLGTTTPPTSSLHANFPSTGALGEPRGRQGTWRGEEVRCSMYEHDGVIEKRAFFCSIDKPNRERVSRAFLSLGRKGWEGLGGGGGGGGTERDEKESARAIYLVKVFKWNKINSSEKVLGLEEVADRCENNLFGSIAG
ncbi:hypothetical protein V1477_014318, partial [Vespula maculifrons]